MGRKRIVDLNVKSKIIWKRRWGSLCVCVCTRDFGVSLKIFKAILKSTGHEGKKNDGYDHIKKFCLVKDTKDISERLVIDLEIFVVFKTDKELISRIYQELPQIKKENLGSFL